MIESRGMSQTEWIHEFNDQNREKFNDELFRRDNMDIVEAVSKVILSCERDKYFTLKVLSINVIEDYEEIYDALRQHEEERLRSKDKDKKTDNVYDYIPMKDSDIILLDVRYLIRKNGMDRIKINGIEKNVENPEQILKVLIALPRYVDKYYARLSGNYYSLITQLVDASTYNNATTANSKVDSTTLKTLFMAVRLFRMMKDVTEYNTREKMRCVMYTSIIFDKHVTAMLYIFAKYGFYATMELFGINCIYVSNEPVTDPNYYCFMKHNLFISCPKIMFQEPVVQSLCMTIYDAIGKDTELEEIFDPRFWLMSLGSSYRNNSIDKGLSALDSLESIYDLLVKEDIRLPKNDKENIYLILKWMITEFSALRAKDNVDVSIKKRRIAEYIAHVYAMKLSRGIRRISDLGKKVKLKNIVSAIYTRPMYIISTIINMSNLVSYVDMVNDNDAMTALKCTYKGISGLGENNASVQECYRLVDPSSIGILDPDASSNSDPGMTAMFCPMTETNGYSFSDFVEPNNWNQALAELNEKYYGARHCVSPIHIDDDRSFGEKYDYIKDDIVKQYINVGRKICPIKDLDGIIDYANNDSFLIQANNSKVEESQSLFTIIEEDDGGMDL